MSALLEAALTYARRGWYVFPLKPEGKAPLGMLVRTGKDEATTDEATIRRWWGAVPEANIGIALAPSGLIALDVDVSGDKQGKESLKSIITELPPRTLTQRTARGGVHALYAAPPDIDATNRIGFKPGLDLIGIGYIVAAPSTFEGKPYTWLNPDTPAEPCPAYLARVATERPAPKATTPTLDGAEPPIPDGQRNATLFAIAGKLRHVGLGEEAIGLALLSTNNRRCHPPLPDDEVLKLAASVMRYQPGPDPTGGIALKALLDPTPADPSQAAQDAPGADSEPGAGGGAPLVGQIASRRRPPIRSYPTLFPTLDVLLGGGWLSRTLHVVLGPPGAGKTAFMVGVALHHVEAGGARSILYGCTELESEEITARCAAPLLGVAWTHLEKGSAMIGGKRVEGEALHAEVGRVLADKRIHVFGSEAMEAGDEAIMQLAREALRITKLYGEPPLVVVDYMQDLARGTDANNVRGKIGDLAMRFRAMAQAFDLPLVVVSSVSRSFYGPSKAETMRNSDDASIYLAAAKESGDVDYAAATVLFLDVAIDDGNDRRPARIAVAKARRGRTGFAGASFEGAPGRWHDDPSALHLMSSEKQRESKADKQISEVEGRIIGTLQAHGPLTKTDLVDRTVGNDHTIKAAIKVMVEGKRLAFVGKKLCMPNAKPGPVAPADPSLAGFVKPEKE
jgi:KaiC/GvpD/RAD55 family RecA-like ATPase